MKGVAEDGFEEPGELLALNCAAGWLGLEYRQANTTLPFN
jgi:hypothetical protein